jgi:hypothetical protein
MNIKLCESLEKSLSTNNNDYEDKDKEFNISNLQSFYPSNTNTIQHGTSLINLSATDASLVVKGNQNNYNNLNPSNLAGGQKGMIPSLNFSETGTLS